MPVSLSEDLTKQNKLIAELFDTEASYLAPLEAFIAATERYANNTVIQQQRIEIKAMILLSKELLCLRQNMSVLPSLAQVAEFFNKNDQSFKIYEPYAATFTDYTQELLKGKNEKNIGKNINTALKLKNPQLITQAEAITITPIQRIPRYILFLKQLVETAPNDNDLSESLTKIERRALALNEAIKTKEQQVKAKSFLKKTPNKLIQQAIENKTGTEIEIILKYAKEINNLKKNRKFYNKNSKDYDTLIKQVEDVITRSFTSEKQNRIKPDHNSMLNALAIASQPKAPTQTLQNTQNTIIFQLMIEQLKATPREEAKKNPATAEQDPLPHPPGIMPGYAAGSESKAKPESKAGPAPKKQEQPPILRRGSIYPAKVLAEANNNVTTLESFLYKTHADNTLTTVYQIASYKCVSVSSSTQSLELSFKDALQRKAYIQPTFSSPEKMGVTYHIDNGLPANEEKQIIKHLCKLAVDAALTTPQAEFDLTNTPPGKIEITKNALREAIQANKKRGCYTQANPEPIIKEHGKILYSSTVASNKPGIK